jgi:hypothetical protein
MYRTWEKVSHEMDVDANTVQCVWHHRMCETCAERVRIILSRHVDMRKLENMRETLIPCAKMQGHRCTSHRIDGQHIWCICFSSLEHGETIRSFHSFYGLGRSRNTNGKQCYVVRGMRRRPPGSGCVPSRFIQGSGLWCIAGSRCKMANGW